jgi:hypothetical protein
LCLFFHKDYFFLICCTAIIIFEPAIYFMQQLKGVFLLVFLILEGFFSYGQDTVVLLNGKTIEGEVLEVTESLVVINVLKKQTIQKREIDAERVFAVQYKNGSEKVLYQQDTTAGAFYTVEEMRYFILGEQDAFKYYRSPDASVLAFLGSAAGGFLFAESFVVILMPILSTGVVNIPRVRAKPGKVSNDNYLEHEAFHDGYERVAKNKRIQNTLKASVFGLITGVATFHAIKKMGEQ